MEAGAAIVADLEDRATFLGGSGNERAHGVAVDAGGNVYVTGRTDSTDFPTTEGSFDPTFNGNVDAFVVKLNADGSALVYSTFLGGTDFDRGHGIAVDAGGNAYVTGEAISFDFPTTAGAFQPAKAGGFNDAFVTKLDPTGSALVYSSYLGGTGSEAPGRLALDADGNAYVTGGTASFDFPTTAGAFQTTKAPNGWDAYVTKVNADGSGLVYSTYLGGSFGDEFGHGIAVDGSGHAYVTGRTSSGTFPVADAFQPGRRGPSDAFVTKLTADDSALVYSSYLGGGRDEIGYGIAVDASGTAHVAGQTNSSGDFSRSKFPTTPDAFQPVFGGGLRTPSSSGSHEVASYG